MRRTHNRRARELCKIRGQKIHFLGSWRPDWGRDGARVFRALRSQPAGRPPREVSPKSRAPHCAGVATPLLACTAALHRRYTNPGLAGFQRRESQWRLIHSFNLDHLKSLNPDKICILLIQISSCFFSLSLSVKEFCHFDPLTPRKLRLHMRFHISTAIELSNKCLFQTRSI